MRPLKNIVEITTLLRPGFAVGDLIDLRGTSYVIMGIHDDFEGYGSSTLQLAKPDWIWKLTDRITRSLRSFKWMMVDAWQAFWDR